MPGFGAFLALMFWGGGVGLAVGLDTDSWVCAIGGGVAGFVGGCAVVALATRVGPVRRVLMDAMHRLTGQ